jgi:hypothetical protein
VKPKVEVVVIVSDLRQTFGRHVIPLRNGKNGYIDLTGKVVIPLIYAEVAEYDAVLFRVKSNGKYGFIDKAGREVTPLKYDEAVEAGERLLKVKLNGKEYYVGKNGTEYYEP